MVSIKELCQRSNISQPTFYRLLKNDSEFSVWIESHRKKKGNGYYYDIEVIERVKEICGKDSDFSLNPQSKIEHPEASEPGVGVEESPSDEIPEQTRPTQTAANAAQIAALEKEVSLLREQNDFLKGQIEDLRREKETISNQLTQMIVLSQMEAQERVLKLTDGQDPERRRLRIRDRIRNIFSKKAIIEETVED